MKHIKTLTCWVSLLRSFLATATEHPAHYGRILTIIWDKTDGKYGKGQGLSVLVDGEEVAHSQTLGRLVGTLSGEQAE